MRLSVLVLIFTQLLRCGKSSTCLLIGGYILSCTRLWLLYKDTKIRIAGTSHAIFHCSFFKTSMENGSCTHHFSLNSQYHFFFAFLKHPVSMHLNIEIPAVSSLFYLCLSFFGFRHHVFHHAGLKYDSYTTHRISLISNLKNIPVRYDSLSM